MKIITKQLFDVTLDALVVEAILDCSRNLGHFIGSARRCIEHNTPSSETVDFKRFIDDLGIVSNFVFNNREETSRAVSCLRNAVSRSDSTEITLTNLSLRELDVIKVLLFTLHIFNQVNIYFDSNCVSQDLLDAMGDMESICAHVRRVF